MAPSLFLIVPLVALGAGVPGLILSAIGFGSAGVVAGSVAASMQGPAVVSGSFFAMAQSAGVVGALAAVKGVVPAVVFGFNGFFLG